MKRSLALLCLFVIMFQSMSQLFILGDFYLNRDYISANICLNRFDAIPICKGQCYLEDKLEKAEQEEQRLPDIKHKDIQLICQSSFFSDLVNPENVQQHKYSIPSEIIYQSNFSVSIFHPPQAA